MKKLYCYVDETGQDTKGKLFLVSVVVVDSKRDELRNKLKHIENLSKKNKKWAKANYNQKIKYLELVANDKSFANSIFYSKYSDTCAYVDLTILTTAKVILNKADSLYRATIFIDGLKRTERNIFAAGLRRLKIKVQKVRGIRDQSDEFIRLADSIAGFVRDSLEHNKVMRSLYEIAEKNGIIKNI